jgi:hypothetical protein
MLQLIGWLGCVYLIVKALEISANPAFKKEAGSADVNSVALAAIGLAFVAAIVFALLFWGQGAALPNY